MDLMKFVEKNRPVEECHLLEKCRFKSPGMVIEYRDARKSSIVKEWEIEEFKKAYADQDMVGLKADHLDRLYVDYGQNRRCLHTHRILIETETIDEDDTEGYWECAYCGRRLSL